MADEIRAAVKNATVRFTTQKIASNYLGEDLKNALNSTGTNAAIREQVAADETIWSNICTCVDAYLKEEKGARQMNGILLLARNLCASDTGKFNAFESEFVDKMCHLFQSIMSDFSQLEVSNRKILKTILQIMANIIAGCKKEAETAEMLSKIVDTEKSSQCKLNDLIQTEFPVEFSAICSAISSSEFLLKNITVADEFIALFSNFLNYFETADQADSDIYSQCSTYICEFFLRILSTDYFFSFYEQLTGLSTRNSALKFIDLMIPDSIDSSVQFLDNIKKLITSELETCLGISEDYFENYSSEIVPDLSEEWDYMLNVLEIVEFACTESSEKTRNALIQTGIVEKIIKLLNNAEANLPKKSKLKHLELNGSQQEWLPHEFPLIKTSLITSLSSLCNGNKQVQDEIRQLHGLEMVLSNCMIDANNPYIRERAIICIKYLLQDNVENQEFVAKLEAKESVTEEALKEAGFETSIEGGKVRLSKKKK